MMVWYGIEPTWRLMFFPVFVLLAMLTALAVGIWLAALNVKYRDFRYVIPFALQFGVYVSPVGFSLAAVPEEYRWWFAVNPAVGLIEGFRWSLLGQANEVTPFAIGVTVAAAVVGLLFGGILDTSGKPRRPSRTSFEAQRVGEPETVIRVENLSKRYVISHAAERGRYSTLRDTIAHGAKSLVRRFTQRREPGADPTREEFWALKDVSFEVKRGDVVGIIGRNGAGKSTLLKILSRITEPTTGRIAIDGRVASLLEVGTGFHPELTGRENVYLNGSILGMSRAEVKRKFDEIVAFAEIEKFLDTPVKRYSSGMYMRLAFAVAAHLEPEILIVDEVLAVGDAAFQKKCMGKMGEVAKGGRTVLFVSHNTCAAIRQICSRSVLLLERSAGYSMPVWNSALTFTRRQVR